jgi:5'-AMP-activated protein kinase regulatory gamma subunit
MMCASSLNFTFHQFSIFPYHFFQFLLPYYPNYLLLHQVLAAYNILSAPVVDAATKEYIGIMDVMDTLNALLLSVYPELLHGDYVQTHKRLSMTELETIGLDFSSQTIATLVHGGDLWYRGDRESTLYEVVQSGFRVGLPPKVHSPLHHLRVHHRIAVFDILPGEETPDGPIPEWQITDVVSQTDILRLLAAKMDILAVKDQGMSASIAELGMIQGSDAVSTVTADTPVILILARMHKEKLSGIGIVGQPGGKLLGNLSASDLRGLTPEKFGALALPVGAFLLMMHPSNGGGGGGKAGIELNVTYEDALVDQLPEAVKEGRWDEALARLPLLSCSPASTLRETIELLVDQGKHRLYCCGESGQAVGVVTPTDILRAVVMASKYQPFPPPSD